MITNALRMAGCDVRQACDGLSALQRIDEDLPDIVLLDLDLPWISGFGVLHDLRSQPHTMDIPVIIVTGSAESLSYLNVDVLRKPFSIEALSEAVRGAVSGRT